MGVSSLAPLLGEPCRFGTHHDGCGLRHVVVVIFVGVLQLRRKDLDVVSFEEGDALF